MTAASSTGGHLLPQAPPLAHRVTAWKRFTTRRAGRRSAAMSVPDAQGHHPATRAMAAEVARVEAELHTALVKAVEALDSSIARTESTIRTTYAGLQREPRTVLDEARSPMTAVEQAARRSAEAAAQAAWNRRGALEQELDRLHAEVADLSQRRAHLHATAVGILASWEARFDELVAHHRIGFMRVLTRTFPSSDLTVEDPANSPLPRYQPVQAWAAGEHLPVTITEVRADQQPALRWARLPSEWMEESPAAP